MLAITFVDSYSLKHFTFKTDGHIELKQILKFPTSPSPFFDTAEIATFAHFMKIAVDLKACLIYFRIVHSAVYILHLVL